MTSGSATAWVVGRGRAAPVADLDAVLTARYGPFEVIETLPLVTGWSMGAGQTYQWAVSCPDMVQRAAPFCGSSQQPEDERARPNGEVRVIPGVWGHFAGSGDCAVDRKWIDDVITELLAR